MSDDPAPLPAALSLEDVAAAVMTIDAGATFAERASRLVSIVRAWCEPSAVLGFARDAAAESGLRALPEISYGHAGPTPERGLARLLDEAGGQRLGEPWLIPPPPEVAGYRVKALDSWLLPWRGARASGFLLLRGIAAPYPANLAQAVSVAAQSVWPLLAASADVSAQLARVDEAARDLQGLVAELRRASAPSPDESERFQAELARQRGLVEAGVAALARAESERDAARAQLAELQARPPDPPAPAVDPALLDDARARVASTQLALEAARAESDALRDEIEQRGARLATQESALAEARAEIERLREQGAPPAPSVDVTALSGELEAAREELARLRAEGEAVRASEQEQRAALAEARAEIERLREASVPPAPGVDVTALSGELETAREELARLRAEGEAVRASEQEQRAALAEARAEIERLREASVPPAPGVDVTALSGELETAREELARLRAEGEAAAAQALAREDELRTLLEAERLRRDTDTQALDGARQALKISEEMLAGQTSELESLRRQRTNLAEQTEAAQRARAAAEAERDRARAEVNPLWATIESLQRELKDGQSRVQAESARAEQAQAEKAEAQAQAGELRQSLAAAEARAGSGELEAAQRRAREAEERVAALTERWDSGAETLRAAWLAFKRTPFVPPTLRLSFGSAQALFDPEAQGAAGVKRPRVLLLDRDTLSLEPLAAELEAEGLDVLVAHYADEAAFFLKTPEGRQLTALVADVMAFRSDAELLERFRAWRLELPALGLLVSFRADDPAESERAKRVPVALGAGHLPRPLARQALVDAVAVASKRAARPAPPR